MKKLVIALTALAAFTGSASAADLAARPYTKAPAAVPVPVPAGPASTSAAAVAVLYTNNDDNDFLTATRACRWPQSDDWRARLVRHGRGGLRLPVRPLGWSASFGDYDFMDVKGDISTFGTTVPSLVGSQKQDWRGRSVAASAMLHCASAC